MTGGLVAIARVLAIYLLVRYCGPYSRVPWWGQAACVLFALVAFLPIAIPWR